RRIVTLTIDNEVEKFQIKQGDKFTEPKVVKEDKENNKRDVQFEIDELDAIVLAKMLVNSKKQRTGATEHDVRLYFEGNSITTVEAAEEEKAELVAEKASIVDYKIIKEDNDEEYSYNDLISCKSIFLEYHGK